MKSLILAASLLISLASCATSDFMTEQNTMSCLIYDSLSFFDLRDMQNTTANYEATSGDTTYYFNLCSFTIATNTTPASCNPNDYVFAYSNTTAGVCDELTNDSLTSLVQELILGADGEGVLFNYSGGANCSASANYTFSIKALCDPNGLSTDPVQVVSLDTNNTCAPQVTVTHNAACAVFSASHYTHYLISRPYILGPILIIFGALVCLFGRQFFAYTIAILGAALGYGVTLMLFAMIVMLNKINSNALKESETSGIDDETAFYRIGTVTVAIIIGIFLGFIMTKMLEIGAAIIGALAGQAVALALYDIILGEGSSIPLLIFLSVFFMGGMAFLSFRYYDIIVIISTAFIGAYAFIRGISLFAGHFPSEYYVIHEISEGNKVHFQWQFWLYFAAWCVVLVGGSLFQYKMRQKELQTVYIKKD